MWCSPHPLPGTHVSELPQVRAAQVQKGQEPLSYVLSPGTSNLMFLRGQPTVRGQSPFL